LVALNGHRRAPELLWTECFVLPLWPNPGQREFAIDDWIFKQREVA
jgi:hypothetical protein